MKKLFLFLFIISLDVYPNNYNLLRYKVLPGDDLGSILNDLGVCPLWGEQGSVLKIAKLNKITANNISNESEILIPYEDLKKIDKVIFLKNRFVIPKLKDAQLCN